VCYIVELNKLMKEIKQTTPKIINMKKSVLYFTFASFLLVDIFFLTSKVLAKTVSLPLSIDYQLLKSIVIKTSFTKPDQSTILMEDNDGCLKIVISEPRFSEKNSHLLFETKIYIHTGIHLFDRCLVPIDWEGYLLLIQKPRINAQWIMSFHTIDSILYDKHHKPAKIFGIVWNHIKASVYEYLHNITIDLAPPVSELHSFLWPLFPADLHARAQKMICSMRPGEIQTSSDAIRVNILTEVEESYARAKDLKQEPISEKQMVRFIKAWEIWDAFLVRMITSLSSEPLTDDDRQVLLDTVLETRHRFIKELSEKAGVKDFVRQQFVGAWKQLSPIFRNHLSDDPSKSVLNYLSFFTASDALLALDDLGPTLGIEISRNGLIRLLQLIGEKESVILTYQPGVNTELRKMLALGPPLSVSNSGFHGNTNGLTPTKEKLDEDKGDTLLHVIKWFFLKSAWAKENMSKGAPENIRKWTVSKKNLAQYLESIKSLLQNTSNAMLKKSKIGQRYHNLYRLLILAIAWQESCYRQFEAQNNKVSYLRSYDGTSVGLMQINERVWRGMYDEQCLRWDIHYNARAGCEIAALYLKRYALKKMKKIGLKNALDDNVLAMVIYAMYNGGPRQFNKFLQRNQKGAYYKSDRLFKEKLIWVKNGQWEYIRRCLIGG
jgi:transcriptional regulator NrdR family protein